jgi:hypothetical protein
MLAKAMLSLIGSIMNEVNASVTSIYEILKVATEQHLPQMILAIVITLLWKGKMLPKTVIKIGMAARGAKAASSFAPRLYQIPLRAL